MTIQQWSVALVVAMQLPSGFGAGAQLTDNVTSPRLIKRVDPEYSAWAFRQRIEGSTVLEAAIQSDGSVTDVRVTMSIDPSGGLDNEAIRAVRQWRFSPGSVPVIMSIDLPFHLPARAPVAGEPPSPESETVFRQGAYDSSTPGLVAPKVTCECHPSYTQDATEQKIQGDVALQALVRADGSIGKVRIVRSADPRYGLDQQAVNAVRTWKFDPATLHGQPVAAVVDVTLWFRLH